MLIASFVLIFFLDCSACKLNHPVIILLNSCSIILPIMSNQIIDVDLYPSIHVGFLDAVSLLKQAPI